MKYCQKNILRYPVVENDSLYLLFLISSFDFSNEHQSFNIVEDKV